MSHVCVCMHVCGCVYVYMANRNITLVLNFFLYFGLIILMPLLLSLIIFNQIVFGVMKLVDIEGHRFYLSLTYFKNIAEDIAHYIIKILPYDA